MLHASGFSGAVSSKCPLDHVPRHLATDVLFLSRKLLRRQRDQVLHAPGESGKSQECKKSDTDPEGEWTSGTLDSCESTTYGTRN